MTKPRFEILVGLHVHDDTRYNQYRAAMTPLLTKAGGFFRYDLRVSEHLAGESQDPINRTFIISFPDEDTKIQFFEDEIYKAIRAEFFDHAVKSSTMMASYHTDK